MINATTNKTTAYTYTTDKLSATTVAPTSKQFIDGIYAGYKAYKNDDRLQSDYENQIENPNETYYLELFLDGTYRVISLTDLPNDHEVTGLLINLTSIHFDYYEIFNELSEVIDRVDDLIKTNKEWGVYS